MNRSEAATTLLQWQLDEERDLVRAAGRDGGRTLVALVESAARGRRRRPRPAGPPPPPVDFLQLGEERAVEDLRVRLLGLAPVLRPDERQRIEARLRDLMPAGEIAGLRAELERFAGRLTRQSLGPDLEAFVAPPPPPEPDAPVLRSVFLFSRDGRLLASEGELRAVDLASLSALVARGEPGSVWSLAHGDGVIVGHIGQRAGLVAFFRGRPNPSVAGALRVALASLEQKDRLANALTHPTSHQALTAYVRAVRSILGREAA